MDFETIKNKLYIFIYGFSFLLCSESIVTFVHYKSIPSIVAFLIFGITFILFARKLESIVKNGVDERYPGEKYDKYFKRLNNLSYLLVYTITILMANVLISGLGKNAKYYEVLTSIRPMILVVECVLMFILIFQKELKICSNRESFFWQSVIL